ncbi:MAG: Bifunctional transcriptional activator/DNA repair enzyme AdaA [Alphaproteobacteria bacterium ADurb.Bin100]|jgi:AraC-like DNA-binding protein|nr:AraC family transcriptional regulator [Comamonadaceae bacterium]OQC09102.1 MAG: Bifunctional transcriptional activator/DNA repair enzyme AdaA [Alphaproteobacteria bacterium ADurb.Bin100]
MAPGCKHRNRDSPVGVVEVANPATLWQSCPVPVRSFTITDAPPTAGAAVTPIAFASTIVAAYQRAGRDPGNALQLAQIPPARLIEADGRMTARQMEVLSGAAMQELDDEGLGAFSRRLPWGSYGMLARASLSAPDLGVALKRWCRHHGLLTGDIRLSVVSAGAQAAIVIDEHADLGAAREFTLVHVLRNIHGLACWYVDSRIPLQEARFPFPAPPYAEVFPILFTPAVSFGTQRAELHFDARYLALPLRRDEAALSQMLQRALPLTVLQYRRDRLLVQRVRQALSAQPLQTHSAEALAALLAVSSRTLHRQLKDEGATLQGLKDEVRRARATELLLRTNRPIKQVAAAAGFLNEKSFIRAFRGWTGQSPAEFRQQAMPPA